MGTGVVVWSKTAATNNTIDSAVNYAEGQAPSSVNDSARGAMASTAKWRDDLNGTLTTAGSSTAYTVTTNQGFAALTAGYEVTCQFDEDCGATVTLNVDGLGAKPLRSAAGVELVAGAIRTGAVYRATYFTSNSGEWILHSVPIVLADSQVATAKIADDAVTYAKIQNVSAQYKILARKTASAGDVEECSLSEVMDFVTSAAQGDILFRGSSGWARLAAGTGGHFLRTNGAAADPDYARVLPLFHVRYVLGNNTTGQTYVSATWSQCLINTELTNEIASASLSSNQLSLPAGTYEIDALIPYTSRNNQATSGAMGRLQNITDTATILSGLSYRTGGGVYGTTWVPLKGRFTLAATKTLQLQFYVEGGADSAPSAANTGASEQYTDIMIRKIG